MVVMSCLSPLPYSIDGSKPLVLPKLKGRGLYKGDDATRHIGSFHTDVLEIYS
jgi:hypothetical protein